MDLRVKCRVQDYYPASQKVAYVRTMDGDEEVFVHASSITPDGSLSFLCSLSKDNISG